jgi:hypothetical protein
MKTRNNREITTASKTILLVEDYIYTASRYDRYGTAASTAAQFKVYFYQLFIQHLEIKYFKPERQANLDNSAVKDKINCIDGTFIKRHLFAP